MPINKGKCCNEVKHALSHIHSTCNKNGKRKKQRTGKFINKFFDSSCIPFNHTSSYDVCHTLNTVLESGKIKKSQAQANKNNECVNRNEISDISEKMIFDQTTSGVAGADDQTRTGRALRRRREIDGIISESKLKKVKTVKIKVDDEVYD
jgi:hypothetical protein